MRRVPGRRQHGDAGHNLLFALQQFQSSGLEDRIEIVRQVAGADALVAQMGKLELAALHGQAAFVRQQFEAQHHHYQTYYPEASFDLVLLDGEPVGRLYVARWTREIRLVDIALVPAARGRGLGTALLRDLLAEGERTGKAVSIHVERFNPALRLYRRLGFREVEEKGPYFLMEWRPPVR